MKRGLAGLVLGLCSLSQPAPAKDIKVSGMTVPGLKEPYAMMLSKLNSERKMYPDHNLFQIYAPNGKSVEILVEKDDVIYITLEDLPFIYQSAGIFGQVNNIQDMQKDKTFIVNKIGEEYPLPIHQELLRGRIMQELTLIQNPQIRSAADYITVGTRNINLQQQFSLSMESFCLDPGLDIESSKVRR